MEKKKNPWTENDVRLWVEDYFTPVISAIAREASMILERMKDDHQYRMNAMLSIYRIEKDDFGESLTVSDWGMASEMTGYTFTMYADEGQKFRQSCIERKWADRKAGSMAPTTLRPNGTEAVMRKSPAAPVAEGRTAARALAASSIMASA